MQPETESGSWSNLIQIDEKQIADEVLGLKRGHRRGVLQKLKTIYKGGCNNSSSTGQFPLGQPNVGLPEDVECYILESHEQFNDYH